MTDRPEHIARAAFAERFGATPRVFIAPGRLNVVGEHTDYSDGFVMPAAIDRRCAVAMAPSADGDVVRVWSLNRNETAELGPAFERRAGWTDYIAGVRASLGDAGVAVPACDLAIFSDVPEGAGVSSSAALEVAVLNAMLAAARASATDIEIAKWAQRAESRYVGVPCGLMDQFAAVFGVVGRALVLDCRTLEHRAMALPERATFVLFDSQVRHRLVDGGYAARRTDCELAAEHLGVPALRDAQLEALAQLPDRLQKRARHVVTENARVDDAAHAMEVGDLALLGAVINRSHASLRDDFEVTCVETDALAAVAAATPGVYGARQMGGGFGGAVLALIDRDSVAAASARIVEGYAAASGLSTQAFVCSAADGAREAFV